MSTGTSRWFRVAFFIYAALLFTMTHWPALELPSGAIPRPDVLAHVGVFALWTLLCVRAGFFGHWLSGRNIALSFLIAIVYVAIDEGTQAIPGLRRHASWDDFAANVLGVCLGMAAVMGIGVLSVDRVTETARSRR